MLTRVALRWSQDRAVFRIASRSGWQVGLMSMLRRQDGGHLRERSVGRQDSVSLPGPTRTSFAATVGWQPEQEPVTALRGTGCVVLLENPVLNPSSG